MYPHANISAVILAGGQGQRMGGQDKGWLLLQERPLIEHVLTALRPQVGQILISANRHQTRYAQYGYLVLSDELSGFQGPLAGIASAMQAASTEYLVTVPVDAPQLSADYVAHLWEGLNTAQAEIAVADDGTRLQPIHALMRVDLLPNLLSYLARGERKVERWYNSQRMARVNFTQQADMFHNINTPQQYAEFMPEKRL